MNCYVSMNGEGGMAKVFVPGVYIPPLDLWLLRKGKKKGRLDLVQG